MSRSGLAFRSTIGLCGDSVLKLPLTSLTEEFKCGKTRLQMTLNESKDPVVRQNAQTLATGRKWNFQQGGGELGLTTSRPGKRSAARRKMVVEKVWHQEELARWTQSSRPWPSGSVDMVGKRKEEVELEGSMGHGSEELELHHLRCLSISN